MNFIQAGVTMLVGVAMFAIVFFVVSTPINSMMDSFDDANTGDATDEMNTYLPNIRTALSMAFALIIVSPIVGFIIWVYSREPDWSYYRRY